MWNSIADILRYASALDRRRHVNYWDIGTLMNAVTVAVSTSFIWMTAVQNNFSYIHIFLGPVVSNQLLYSLDRIGT